MSRARMCADSSALIEGSLGLGLTGRPPFSLNSRSASELIRDCSEKSRRIAAVCSRIARLRSTVCSVRDCRRRGVEETPGYGSLEKAR